MKSAPATHLSSVSSLSLWLRAWLTQLCLRLAWRWLVGSQHFIRLTDLAIETGDGPLCVGTVIISTRGVFVVETWRADRDTPLATSYDESLDYCDARARVIAEALGEDHCLVSPVMVLTGDCRLPEAKPVNVVSEFGLVQYIGSFKADVFSDERIEAIAQRLGQLPKPSATAA